MSTYINEPTATTGDVATGPGRLWAAVAVNRAGDAFSELGDTTPTSETCTDPNVPWCDPAGD